MEKRLTMILAYLFLSVGVALAQMHVTGTVTSAEDGEPVIGASVKVVGTNTGAATGLNGEFTLTVATNAKISISYIGMQTQTLTAKPTMNIVLEPNDRTLDEVMVVAYGTQKKSAFTGSAAVVKSDDISKVQVTSPVEALKGKVSGIQMLQASGQPGGTSKLYIRGISSINSGRTPLYVVDGSPFDGDLNTINPQDIENITVLKDAASAALYGARGANGVVMVTTKNGRTDRSYMTVDAKWGVTSRAIPDYEYINDPAGYYETWYRGLYNYAKNARQYSDTQAMEFANQHLTANDSFGLGYNVYNVPQGEHMIGTDGKLNPKATLGNVISYNGNQYMLYPDDWTKATYKHSLRQEYSVTANGSTEKSTFYTSANYLDLEGITKNSDYKRFTARLKGDYQIKPWLKVGANMNYAHYTQNSIANDGKNGSSGNMFSLTKVAPIYPLYIRDGQGNIMWHQESGIRLYDYGDGKINGAQRPYLSQANPLSDVQVNLRYNEGNTFNGVGTMEIRFLKDFRFSSTNSVYLDEYRENHTTNPWFGQYASSKGIATVGHERRWSYNYQQLLNWHHVFGQHDVEAMVGHEYYRTRVYSLSGDKSNMFSNDYPELNGAAITQSASSEKTDYNTEGWFGRAHYSYGDKYFGEFSFRRDASSYFDPSCRWGNFWSLGGAWIISKEKWFNAPWVDELKFKTSYGEQGNDAIGAFNYINTYTITPSAGNISLLPRRKGNTKISWEKQGMFNAGFDFSFFRQRLTGSIVYFSRQTNDMLAWFTLPPSFGWTGYYANIGDMRNTGVEVELNGDILRTKDLVWSAHMNLTSYRNRITRLADRNKTLTIEGKHGYTSGNYFYAEKLPIYTYYIYKYAGVDQNTGEALYYKDVPKKDANGQIMKDEAGNQIIDHQETTNKVSDATMYLCGTALPDAYGGFGTSLAWKGLDISVDFTYQLGGQVYDRDYASSMNLDRGHTLHTDILNAWSADNKGSNIPRLQFNDKYMTATSDRFLTSASYLSLQNITIGYTLPKRWLRTLSIAKVRVYAVGDNLWLWSKRKGLDPRQNISGSVSSEYYSPIRTVSGGITVTF